MYLSIVARANDDTPNSTLGHHYSTYLTKQDVALPLDQSILLKLHSERQSFWQRERRGKHSAKGQGLSLANSTVMMNTTGASGRGLLHIAARRLR